MKDRNWFNRKLYLDTLRQLRVMGITYLAICLAVSWIPPLTMFLGDDPGYIDIQTFVPALFLLMTLGAITMVYNAFSYLFSRRASDYFHALPTRRSGVAISRYLAVLTWLWGIIVVTTVSTMLVFGLLCGQWYFALVPFSIGYFSTVTLFYSAAALCGVSLTGTRFSALIVTGLVAFMVRFLLTLFATTVVYFAPSVSISGFGLLLNPFQNIATSTLMLPFGMYGGYSVDMIDMMTSLWPMVYTFVVGALYTALGLWLYHKRKSETAGKSAPNSILQTLYRCGITLPFVLSFVIQLYMFNDNIGSAIIHNSTLVLTAVVFTLIVYLAYEVITQKRLKGLLKTLPYYAALIAFCVLFSMTAKSMALRQQHILPEAEDVSGITLDQYGNNSYTDLVLENYVIQNEQVEQLVINALKSNVQHYDIEGRDWPRERQLTVRLHRNHGSDLVRNIYFSAGEMVSLQNSLIADKGYMQCIRQLPNGNDIQSMHISGLSLSQQQLLSFYEALVSELKSLSDEDYANLINTKFATSSAYPEYADDRAQQASKLTMLDNLVFSGQIKFHRYTSSIMITPKTPHTMTHYINIVQQENLAWLKAVIPVSPQDKAYQDMSLSLFDLQSETELNAYDSIYDDNKERKAEIGAAQMSAFALIAQAVYQPQSKYLLRVSLAVGGDEMNEKVGYGYDRRTSYVYLTKDQAQTLQTLLKFE